MQKLFFYLSVVTLIPAIYGAAGVSIADLIAKGAIPQMESLGVDHETKHESFMLNLSKKGITSLVGLANIPGIDKVTNLQLSENHLTKLDDNDLAPLPSHLTSLWLDHNQLSNIDLDAFNKLPLLRALALNNNRLSVLKNGTFANNNNLRTINIADNPSITVEQGTFTELENRNTPRFEGVFTGR